MIYRYRHTIGAVQRKVQKPLILLGFLDFFIKFALFYIANTLHSATVNPAPLPLPTVVPYARTPTGQGVDCLVLGVFSAMPKKGTVSAKADTPLFRLPIIPPKTAPLT